MLEATLEATRDAILVVDLDQRILCFNRRYLDMFGFTAGELERGGIDSQTREVVAAGVPLGGGVTALAAAGAIAGATTATVQDEVVHPHRQSGVDVPLDVLGAHLVADRDAPRGLPDLVGEPPVVVQRPPVGEP